MSVNRKRPTATEALGDEWFRLFEDDSVLADVPDGMAFSPDKRVPTSTHNFFFSFFVVLKFSSFFRVLPLAPFFDFRSTPH